MHHSQNQRLQNSDTDIGTSSGKSYSTYYGNSKRSTRSQVITLFSEHKEETPSLATQNPRKSHGVSESLPCFGNQSNTLVRSPKQELSKSHQKENFYPKAGDPSTSPLENSLSNQNFDYPSQIESEYFSKRPTHVNSNLKQSNSYINAMKALQNKLKVLEDQLSMERKVLEDTFRSELDAFVLKFETEKSSQREAENILKNKIERYEEELRSKERILEDQNYEIENLKKLSSELEAEKVEEVERLINEKKRIKHQFKELEEKYLQKLKMDEESRAKNIQLEHSLREKENEVLKLKETISKLEKEKVALNNQFGQKIEEISIKNKQLEEKWRENEVELQNELKKIRNQCENFERENKKLKQFKTELEDNLIQMEKVVLENENASEEKSRLILQQREEMEVLIKELGKIKLENERINSFAQEMTQLNERMINSLIDKSRSNREFSELDVNPESQKTLPIFTSQEYMKGFDDLYPIMRKQQTEGRERVSEFGRNENQPYSKTPRARDRSLGLSIHMRGNSLVSPQHLRGNSLLQPIRVSGEDLSTSEMSGRRKKQEPKSPQKSFSFEKRDGLSMLRFTAERTNEIQRNVTREVNMDKLELEKIIKEIIEIQKEMLEYNKECQIVMNDLMRINRESPEYPIKKKILYDIEERIKGKNLQLLELKKAEELISKSRVI